MRFVTYIILPFVASVLADNFIVVLDPAANLEDFVEKIENIEDDNFNITIIDEYPDFNLVAVETDELGAAALGAYEEVVGIETEQPYTVNVPEDTPNPTTEPTSIPITEPEPESTTESIPEPTYEPGSETISESQSDLIPEPTPEPSPEPVPEFTSEPTPESTPAFTSGPVPELSSDNIPEPSPTPSFTIGSESVLELSPTSSFESIFEPTSEPSSEPSTQFPTAGFPFGERF